MSGLIKRLKEERIQGSSAVLNYSNFDYWVNWDDIVDIVEDYKQPQLNENQQVVLDWLQRKYLSVDISPIELIWRLKVNSERNGWKARQPSIAFKELSKRQHTEVLQVFSQWAHEQEAE